MLTKGRLELNEDVVVAYFLDLGSLCQIPSYCLCRIRYQCVISRGQSLRVDLSSIDGNKGSGGGPFSMRVMTGETQQGTTDRQDEVTGNNDQHVQFVRGTNEASSAADEVTDQERFWQKSPARTSTGHSKIARMLRTRPPIQVGTRALRSHL